MGLTEIRMSLNQLKLNFDSSFKTNLHHLLNNSLVNNIEKYQMLKQLFSVTSDLNDLLAPYDLLVHGWLLQGRAWEMDTVQREGVRALEQLAGGWRV